MSPPRAQLWTIDAIDEGTARVAVHGGDVVHVPVWLLPAEAGEGEVLRVRHARDGERSRLVVTRDAAATERARAHSARQVAGIPVAADGGGDVAL
jgi:hypothetical protein